MNVFRVSQQVPSMTLHLLTLRQRSQVSPTRKTKPLRLNVPSRRRAVCFSSAHTLLSSAHTPLPRLRSPRHLKRLPPPASRFAFSPRWVPSSLLSGTELSFSLAVLLSSSLNSSVCGRECLQERNLASGLFLTNTQKELSNCNSIDTSQSHESFASAPSRLKPLSRLPPRPLLSPPRPKLRVERWAPRRMSRPPYIRPLPPRERLMQRSSRKDGMVCSTPQPPPPRRLFSASRS